MNRTDRLMAILLEMQAHGERRADDLARTFEISVRTVYRDMQALAEAGVPLVATPGRGYQLMEGYFLPPLSFTADEAALLVLGGEFVRDRVDAELRRVADSALTKLTAVLPATRRVEVDRWRAELYFASLAPAAQARLGQLRSAVQERRVLRLLYHTYRRPAPEWRAVEPITLVHLADTWHLGAYCQLRQATRLFRLDRIDQIEGTTEHFELGERHRWEEQSTVDQPPVIEVRVRFAPQVERWAREQPPHFFRRVETTADGPVFVYAWRGEPAVVNWLLAWGGGLVVLDPPAMLQQLAREARAILVRYAAVAEPHQNRERSPALLT